MSEIKFDLALLNSYLKDNNIQLSDKDTAQINSIFAQCDTDNEKGESGADGILTGNEVPAFQKLIMEKLSNIAHHLKDFLDNLAKQNGIAHQPQMPEIQQVKCNKTEQEQLEYKAKFEEAKKILLENKKTIGLTQQEIDYIKNIDIESITVTNPSTIQTKNGTRQGFYPARYDREKDMVHLNINDNLPPEVGSFVKIIMHEVTHGVLKNTEHTQEQELACEKRGITVAKKLYESMDEKGKKDFEFHINPELSITDLKDDNDINNYLNDWIKNYSYLPTLGTLQTSQNIIK